jgi:uncharacterized paraquat-inducible protein A
MNWFIERVLLGRADRQTISKYAKGTDRYLGIGIVVSAALLGIAATSPILTTVDFLGLTGSFSLIELMIDLVKGGQGAIAILTFVVSLLAPVFMLSGAFELWYKHELQGDAFEIKAGRLRQYGRYWYLMFLVLIIGLYAASHVGVDTVLHLPVYYLVLSSALIKLILARMTLLLNLVEFVSDDGDV